MRILHLLKNASYGGVVWTRLLSGLSGNLDVLLSMLEPIKPVGGWRGLPDARPHVTTSGFAVDSHGRFPMLFRGPNVRSARNRWSLPSGLHVCGRTLAQQFCVELYEECGLISDPTTAVEIATYEAIAPELILENSTAPQYHWVLHILAVRVETLDTFKNSEPDKHPETKIVHWDALDRLTKELQWTPNLAECLRDNLKKSTEVLAQLAGIPEDVLKFPRSEFQSLVTPVDP